MFVIGLGILGGITTYFVKGETTYTAPEVVEKEVTVEVETLDKRIADALHASSTEIEADAQKAYQYAKEQAELEIKTKVRDQYLAEIEKINIEEKKKLDSYWRSKSHIVQLIREYFPDDYERALAVAKCESGLNPKAVNNKNKNGTTDGGLWQINDVHDARLEELGLDKYHPEDATKFARMLYEENGWRDWVCIKMI